MDRRKNWQPRLQVSEKRVVASASSFEGDLKEKGLKHIFAHDTTVRYCFEGDLKEKGLKRMLQWVTSTQRVLKET